MRRHVSTLLFGFLAAAVALAAAESGGGSETDRILAGTYKSHFDSGPIRGTFSANGDNNGVPVWSVVFRVTFDTADYYYRGFAEGSLDEGDLWGEVLNEAETETYFFSGTHRNGKYEATHAEITDGFMEPTGSMTLTEGESAE